VCQQRHVIATSTYREHSAYYLRHEPPIPEKKEKRMSAFQPAPEPITWTPSK
jgi:hypothetical protein